MLLERRRCCHSRDISATEWNPHRILVSGPRRTSRSGKWKAHRSLPNLLPRKANKQSTVWKFSTSKKRPDILLTVWMSERYKPAGLSRIIQRSEKGAKKICFSNLFCLTSLNLFINYEQIFALTKIVRGSLESATRAYPKTWNSMENADEIRKYFSRIVIRKIWKLKYERKPYSLSLMTASW